MRTSDDDLDDDRIDAKMQELLNSVETSLKWLDFVREKNLPLNIVATAERILQRDVDRYAYFRERYGRRTLSNVRPTSFLRPDAS